MTVYNQLEGPVIDAVNQFYDALDDSVRCDCDQCRLDVICYVLNRLSPKYVVSERGFTHLELDQSIQETADVMALVKEGSDRVARSRRPHGDAAEHEPAAMHEGRWRNFPILSGLVLSGATFEPIVNATVELRIAGTRARMKNMKWRNPLMIPEQARGRFSFWPSAIPIDGNAKPSVLDFELFVQAEGYENAHRYFQLTVDASSTVAASPKSTHEVDNIHLFAAE